MVDLLTLMRCTRYISIEEIEVLSVVTGEFIDAFHDGKEEKVHTFEQLRVRMHGCSEDIRKLLIEHELVRRIAIMLRRQTQLLKSSSQTGVMEERTGGNRKRSYNIPNELRR